EACRHHPTFWAGRQRRWGRRHLAGQPQGDRGSMSKISPLAQRAPGFNRLVRNNSSGVTKGQRMFVELGDARSAWARRWADLIVAHVSDLGGPETLSEAQVSICRIAAATEIAVEQIEARMSEGQQIDLNQPEQSR